MPPTKMPRRRLATRRSDTRIPAATQIERPGEGHPWTDPGAVRLCRIWNDDPFYVLQLFGRYRTAPGNITAPMHATSVLRLPGLRRLHRATARAIADLTRTPRHGRKER